jgi:rare lipoprotein A
VKRVGPSAGAALLLAALLCGCGSHPARPPPTPTVVAVPATTTSATEHRPSDTELLAVPDAVPRHEPRARLGNPAFYEVLGQRYTVMADSSGYLERGVASWYGRDFHGERTSTGEPYDMYSMTAAHRTLPLPAYARVTNLRNGRSIVVRINDRGPFKANRIIDLSYAAALRLDMVRDGTTLVEVRAVAPEGAPPPPPRPAELYAQAGAFAVEANARTLRDQIAAAGVDHVLLRADAGAGGTLYRVRIGPIDSVAAFDALVARLRGAGISGVTLAPN